MKKNQNITYANGPENQGELKLPLISDPYCKSYSIFKL